MTRQGGWRLGHRPQLDGLRGLAVLLVLVGHTGFATVNTAGGIGVTMFFTLSGFLITALLLEERARTGRISLRHFYLRRALRLLPALVLFLASMGVLAQLSDKETVPTAGDFLGALFYVSNYTTAMQEHDNVIVHTWSLAVEEQFYIVWPLLLVAVLSVTRGRLRVLAAIAGAASVLAVLLRHQLWDDGQGFMRIYFGTDTRMDCLLVGCLAAMFMHTRAPGRNRPVLAAAALTGVVVLSLGNGAVEFLVVPLVVPILTAIAIVAVVQAPMSGWLTSRAMRLVGQRSYGLYLWHFPLFGAAANLALPARWPALAVAALLTAGVVHLSWRCVEEPFLRLKKRHGHDGASAVPIAMEPSRWGPEATEAATAPTCPEIVERLASRPGAV